MVVMVAPSACQANIVQAFTALPFMWTTQAPHCEVSHPTWVPVRRRPSRRYCTSKVRASASAVTALPFTVMETAGISLLLEKAGPKALILRPNTPVRPVLGAKSGRFCRKSLIGTRTTLNRGAMEGQGTRAREGRGFAAGNPRLATMAAALHGWTAHRAERAEDATITRQRPESRVAAPANVEKLTRIHRHALFALMSAC